MLARTIVLFTSLTLLFMLISFVVGLYFGDPLYFMFFGLVLAGVMNFVAYEWSDKFVLWSTHTKLITQRDNPQLFSVVQKVANEARIPMPRVGIVESAQPNAFATGKGPNKSIVVATTGILRMLTLSELEAVIGHEISHVTHRDVLVSSIAATLAGAISYVGQIVIFSSFFGGFGGYSRGRSQQDSSYAILAILAAILIPIAAMLVQLGISRSRETSADEAGARLTQKPQELVNPLRGSSVAGLFSTHPPLERRIKAIQKVGMELGVIVI